MLEISYIYIGLSVFSLLLIIRIIRIQEKKKILRYHGITVKRRKLFFKI